MWSIIMTFLKNLSPMAYLSGLLGIALVILSVMYGIKVLEVEADDAKVVQLSTTIQTMKLTQNSIKQQRDQCLTDISVQNSAIDVLKKKSGVLQAKAVAVQKDVTAKESRIQTLINAIIEKPVPKDCEGAMRELSIFVKTYANEWNAK